MSSPLPALNDNITAVLKRHARMVLDPWRTLPLKTAIEKTVRPGNIVVDCGCGIGILSFYACQAGAKKVFAIDCDGESIAVGQWLAKKYGWADRIVWFEDLACNIDLPEKADVLIQETIGTLGFDENFLATLADAKKRFLKKSGKIIPQQVELWGQLGSAQRPASIPKCLAKIIASQYRKDRLALKTKFIATRNAPIKEVTVWPRVIWGKNSVTDCAPHLPMTHWGQANLKVTPKKIKKNEAVCFELRFAPHPQNPWVQTEMLWRLTSARRIR